MFKSKVLSGFILIFFICSLGNGCVYGAGNTTSNQELRSDNKIILDSKFGKLIENYKTRTKDRKLYIIEDLHCNREAQENTKYILEYINSRHGKIDLIGIEGSVGEINTNIISKIENVKAREEVIKRLLGKGYISGAEIYVVENEGQELYGIENKDLYNKDFEMLYNGLSYRAKINKVAMKMEQSIARVKNILTNKDLLELDTEQAKYDKGDIGLNDYIKYLKKKAIANGVSEEQYEKEYKLLDEYNRVCDLNDTMHETTIKLEAMALTKQLKGILDEKEAKLLDADSQDILYYENLNQILTKKRINYREQYPALAQYLDYRIRRDSIDESQVLELKDDLEYKVKELFATYKDLKDLIYLERYLSLLKAYINNELSLTKVEEYEKGKHEFYKIVKDLGSRISRINYIHENRELIDKAYKSMQAFYKLAEKRNQILVKNMLTQLSYIHDKYINESTNRNRNKEPQIGVMIVGGYHSDGICKVLRGKGVAYEVIRPTVKGGVNKDIYIKRLKEQAEYMNVGSNNSYMSVSERSYDSNNTLGFNNLEDILDNKRDNNGLYLNTDAYELCLGLKSGPKGEGYGKVLIDALMPFYTREELDNIHEEIADASKKVVQKVSDHSMKSAVGAIADAACFLTGADILEFKRLIEIVITWTPEHIARFVKEAFSGASYKYTKRITDTLELFSEVCSEYDWKMEILETKRRDEENFVPQANVWTEKSEDGQITLYITKKFLRVIGLEGAFLLEYQFTRLLNQAGRVHEPVERFISDLRKKYVANGKKEEDLNGIKTRYQGLLQELGIEDIEELVQRIETGDSNHNIAMTYAGEELKTFLERIEFLEKCVDNECTAPEKKKYKDGKDPEKNNIDLSRSFSRLFSNCLKPQDPRLERLRFLAENVLSDKTKRLGFEYASVGKNKKSLLGYLMWKYNQRFYDGFRLVFQNIDPKSVDQTISFEIDYDEEPTRDRTLLEVAILNPKINMTKDKLMLIEYLLNAGARISARILLDVFQVAKVVGEKGLRDLNFEEKKAMYDIFEKYMIKHSNGAGPLHYFIKKNELEAMNTLFVFKNIIDIDVNKSDVNGYTPLYLACKDACDATKYRSIDFIKALLENGAKESIKIQAINDNLRTPLHVALSNGRIDIAELMVPYLEKSDTEANIADDHGNTYLYYSLRQEERNKNNFEYKKRWEKVSSMLREKGARDDLVKRDEKPKRRQYGSWTRESRRDGARSSLPSGGRGTRRGTSSRYRRTSQWPEDKEPRRSQKEIELGEKLENAIKTKHPETIKEVLDEIKKSTVDINKLTFSTYMPGENQMTTQPLLHYLIGLNAEANGEYSGIIKYIIDNDIVDLRKTNFKNTEEAIHIVVKLDDRNTFIWLLEKDNNIFKAEIYNTNNTLLQYLILLGRVDMFEAYFDLLHNFFPKEKDRINMINKKDKQGNTALHLLSYNLYDNLKRLDMQRKTRDMNKIEELRKSFIKSYERSVNMLLENGAYYKTQNKKRQNAFYSIPYDPKTVWANSEYNKIRRRLIFSLEMESLSNIVDRGVWNNIQMLGDEDPEFKNRLEMYMSANDRFFNNPGDKEIRAMELLEIRIKELKRQQQGQGQGQVQVLNQTLNNMINDVLNPALIDFQNRLETHRVLEKLRDKQLEAKLLQNGASESSDRSDSAVDLEKDIGFLFKKLRSKFGEDDKDMKVGPEDVVLLRQFDNTSLRRIFFPSEGESKDKIMHITYFSPDDNIDNSALGRDAKAKGASCDIFSIDNPRIFLEEREMRYDEQWMSNNSYILRQVNYLHGLVAVEVIKIDKDEEGNYIFNLIDRKMITNCIIDENNIRGENRIFDRVMSKAGMLIDKFSNNMPYDYYRLVDIVRGLIRLKFKDQIRYGVPKDKVDRFSDSLVAI